MAVRGRTPEKGEQGITFTHDKCHGEKRSGWLSGDVHVLTCHVGKGVSKPCEKALLGIEHHCPGCEAKRPMEDLGYVPLRDQTGKPVCVIVRKERIPFVGNLDRGLSVLYGRDPGRFEGVWVTPNPKQSVWDHYFTKPPRDDMSYWLPKFLGVPHLAAAMKELFAPGEERQPVVIESIPAPIAPIVTPLSPTPVPEKTLPAEPASKTLEDTLKIMRKRFTRAAESRNGVHQE